ncbi:hypothetical protein N7455_002409 [Penicillium solitum]|uniref:uncharacterized protein n=1 Tax=Penicillium solitum TaxID=60172 RepID=UPI0032C4057C|nr:hypothetical protein N7455_002409 [Penicillium solitum]
MKPVAALFVVSLASAAYGWKVGDSSTGSTDPDVTTKCTQWANDISSKDSCKALQKEFDIDFQQLHEWNPSLLKDPCVPIEGWSYCVGSSSKSNDQASGMGTAAPSLHLSTSTGSTATSTEAISLPSQSTESAGTATGNSATASSASSSPSATGTSDGTCLMAIEGTGIVMAGCSLFISLFL